MSKKIITKSSILPHIIDGTCEIADIVKRTLGPGGLPILIERKGQALDGTPLPPKITKDGVSVAIECNSDIPEKDLIIQTIKSICKKTNTKAGDGTTTAIVLGEAILESFLSELEKDSSLNPQLVKGSLEAASELVFKELEALRVAVKNVKMIDHVATISANGDFEVGALIAQAFEKVGAEGQITVDEGFSRDTVLDVVEGYQFNRGAEGYNYFFNNSDQTKFEAENVDIIIYDGKLYNYTELQSALEKIHEAHKLNNEAFPPILVIANEFSPEVINFLVIQKTQGGLQFCAVKGPHMTTVRSQYYDDLAVAMGGTRLGNGNKSLSAFVFGDEGMANKVVVDKYKTTIYGGQGDEEEILLRVDQLKAAKAIAESPYDAQLIDDRLAALTNGIAKISVGGSTEFEIKEKYDRIEDALNASRAALQEGIVAGGGVALLKIAHNIFDSKKNATIGEKILGTALKAPFYQILDNIGTKLSEKDLNAILTGKNKVFDARNKKVVDAVKHGIIDPVKVTRCALENAISVAGLLATSGGGIYYTKSPK